MRKIPAFRKLIGTFYTPFITPPPPPPSTHPPNRAENTITTDYGQERMSLVMGCTPRGNLILTIERISQIYQFGQDTEC